MEGAVFKRLAANDPRGPFLGEIVDCCQSIGGAGQACARHGVESPDSGFYVVEKNGEILGETWAWRGTKGELCFDSLETLGDRISNKQWAKLIKAFAKEAQKKKKKATPLHLGMGGGTPHAILIVGVEADRVAAQPKGYDGYRDSNQQIRIWVEDPFLGLSK